MSFLWCNDKVGGSAANFITQTCKKGDPNLGVGRAVNLKDRDPACLIQLLGVPGTLGLRGVSAGFPWSSLCAQLPRVQVPPFYKDAQSLAPSGRAQTRRRWHHPLQSRKCQDAELSPSWESTEALWGGRCSTSNLTTLCFFLYLENNSQEIKASHFCSSRVSF